MHTHITIGNYLVNLLHSTFSQFRSTGRTDAMIDSLKGDELIVTGISSEAKRIQRILVDKKIKATVISFNPFGQGMELLHRHIRGKQNYSRVVFEHTFSEQFYLDAVAQAGKHLTDISDSMTRRYNEQTTGEKIPPTLSERPDGW